MRIKVSEEVKRAIEQGLPVVALESTIISHGMPYPKNVQTAYEVEETVRRNGAIPATIGIIDGVPVVGMSKEEIEEFGKRKGVLKASRRDLPVIIAKKLWGATTVATTMIFAHMACVGGCINGAGCLTHSEKNKADVDKYGREALEKTITAAVSILK